MARVSPERAASRAGQSVAIIISVAIIVNVSASTDYIKERSFRELSQTLNASNKKVVTRHGVLLEVEDEACIARAALGMRELAEQEAAVGAEHEILELAHLLQRLTGPHVLVAAVLTAPLVEQPRRVRRREEARALGLRSVEFLGRAHALSLCLVVGGHDLREPRLHGSALLWRSHVWMQLGEVEPDLRNRRLVLLPLVSESESGLLSGETLATPVPLQRL